MLASPVQSLCSCEYTCQRDQKEIGYEVVGCINLAQDTDHVAGSCEQHKKKKPSGTTKGGKFLTD
jgi:hypothetical protein